MKERTKVYIATDGSAVNNGNNTFTCASGITIKIGDNIKEYGVELPNSTVNIAELTGVLFALKKIELLDNDIYEFIFIMDSEYTLKSITEWFPSWDKNRDSNGIPRTSNNTPVKNFELIKTIYYLLKKIKYKKVLKIKSHILDKDLLKTYTKFIGKNKYKLDFEEYITMKNLNEISDKIADDTVKKILKRKKE